MDEAEEVVTMTAGERLRAAREAAGMTLEDVATVTRIPTRHLESLESGDFDRLPAPTYSVGFAKSYAGAVGLDKREIGDQLRAEVGGTRVSAYTPEFLEPIDPARTMPRWLIVAAIIAIVLVALAANWLRRDSLNGPDAVEPAAVDQTAPATVAPASAAPPIAAPVASGPVVLTATDEVWLQIKDGPVTLKEGTMTAGQSFEVPATATAPRLTTGKPQAIRITVGGAEAPPVGPPATTVSKVSLLGPDLMRAPASASPASPAPGPGQPPTR